MRTLFGHIGAFLLNFLEEYLNHFFVIFNYQIISLRGLKVEEYVQN